MTDSPRQLPAWQALQQRWPHAARLTGKAPQLKQGTWDAWGHYHIMLGLLLWHEDTGDKRALDCARRIGDLFCVKFLGEKQPRLVDTGSTEMNLAPIHSLCLLYKLTGERRYLDLALQIADEFAAVDAEGAGNGVEQAHAASDRSRSQSQLERTQQRTAPYGASVIESAAANFEWQWVHARPTSLVRAGPRPSCTVTLCVAAA